MSIPLVKQQPAQPGNDVIAGSQARKNTFLPWLRTWELYPILFIAGFLRLYDINKSLFTDDQAAIYRMAHDALVHGVGPATSNMSSTRILHSPISVYFYMLPASLSADPLWGNAFTALCNILAVLLAYIFTRRYFGRLAAIIVAGLYATGAAAIEYSRFIWQPNLVPPLVILFLFALFRGVVERRKGWLFPALLLYGLLGQLHESNYLLIFPLIVALLLARRTIHWRDLVLGLTSLVIIYLPYLLWEISIRFGDIPTLISSPRSTAPHIDGQVIRFYRFFISPFEQNSVFRIDRLPSDPRSILVNSWPRHFRLLLSFVHFIMPLLLICGMFTAGILALSSQLHATVVGTNRDTPPAQSGLRGWWADFVMTPHRQGLALLLIWQIVPLVILLRHTIPLEPHYLMLFLPGQYILIALFISTLVRIFQRYAPAWQRIVRYGTYGCVGLLIAVQTFGSTTVLVDNVSGHFDDAPTYPYYNDLGSLQHALAEADQVAQERHIHRIYVTTDDSTGVSLPYLVEQMRTPTATFDVFGEHCLVLPNLSAGPALFLEDSYKAVLNALLNHYTNATLLDRPARLGATWDPFKLYLLTPRPMLDASAFVSQTFTSDLRLLDPHPLQFNLNLAGKTGSWVHTRWQFMNSMRPSWRTAYRYHFKEQAAGGAVGEFTCSLTRIWAGDELLAGVRITQQDVATSPLTLQVSAATSVPTTVSYGPINLETFINHIAASKTLRTSDGKDSITLN